jgi:hypothetical protein
VCGLLNIGHIVIVRPSLKYAVRLQSSPEQANATTLYEMLVPLSVATAAPCEAHLAKERDSLHQTQSPDRTNAARKSFPQAEPPEYP